MSSSSGRVSLDSASCSHDNRLRTLAFREKWIRFEANLNDEVSVVVTFQNNRLTGIKRVSANMNALQKRKVYFSINSVSQTSQRKGRSTSETAPADLQNPKRRKTVDFKRIKGLERIVSNPNKQEFRTVHHSKSTGNQTIEWDEEALLSNLNSLQFRQSIQLKESDSDETLVIDDDSFQ